MIKMFRLAMAFWLAVSVMIAKLVESQAGFWDGSFLLLASTLFILGLRVAGRWESGRWAIDNEWMYFPYYGLMLTALWWWVRVWDVAFIFVGIFATYLWLDYLRERLRATDPGNEHMPQ